MSTPSPTLLDSTSRREVARSASEKRRLPLPSTTGKTMSRSSFTDLAAAEARLRLVSIAGTAARRGVITAAEASRWEEDLRERDAGGVFACHLLTFVARGRRPG